LAFAHKYKEDGGVNMAYFGDGASNQGQVFESFNMAALWKLPVVYVIENNRYGMGTSVSRASAVKELYSRGAAFGIPGVSVDGMDVLAVKEAGVKALEHARSGKGPFILGMQTYRYRGHSMSDPAKYRSREEVSKVRSERDPIDRARQYVMESNAASEEDLKQIDADVKAIVSDAAEFSQQSPVPEMSELYTDILIEA
jgi:pyruvate dehydrogenase E1 component alpha subunit